MKTLNFFLIVSFLAIGSLAYSAPEALPSATRIPITKALQNPAMVKAMYQQIDESLIQNEQLALYEAKIKFGRSVYIIYGKLQEWQRFFLMEPSYKENTEAKE